MPARSPPVTSRPWCARSSSAPASSPGRGASFRFRHILIQQAAYRTTPKRVCARSFTSASPHGSATRRATESPSTRRSSAITSSRRFATEPSWARSASRSSSWRGAPAHHLASAGQRAFQRGDMPATANLLGRAASLPASNGEAGLAALPELGYALFEIGEVDEASAVLADARERGARRRGSRHASGASRSRARASRCTGTPRGSTWMRSPRRPRRRSRCSASSATRPGWRERGWFSPTSTGARGGFARRAMRRPGRPSMRGARQSPRGRLGAGAERPLRDPRPDAGRRGSELARAVAPSGAGEPHPGCEPVRVRHRARGDERALRRGAGAHRGDPRPRARPRPDVAGGRPGAAQRLRRAAGRRPGRRRARHAGGRAGLPRDRRGMVPVDRRGRPAPGRLRAGALRRRLRAARSRSRKRRRPPIASGRSSAPAFPRDCSPDGDELEEAEKLAREGVAVAADSEFVVLHADVLLDLAEVLRLAGRDGGRGRGRRRGGEPLRTQGQRRRGEQRRGRRFLERGGTPARSRIAKRLADRVGAQRGGAGRADAGPSSTPRSTCPSRRPAKTKRKQRRRNDPVATGRGRNRPELDDEAGSADAGRDDRGPGEAQDEVVDARCRRWRW